MPRAAIESLNRHRAPPLLQECFQWFGLLVLCLTCFGCARGLEVRNPRVLGVEKDEETQASRVSITFEVWDGDVQLTELSRESFQIYEDGVKATSESLAQADVGENRVPLVLVLDTSLSMYQANAVPELKAAASSFQQRVSQQGFDVIVYRFANTVTQIDDISAIPDVFAEKGGERFTSLYAAVDKALAVHTDGIVVVFSDGADTYSQNLGVHSVGDVERFIRPVDGAGGRVVHAIAFGNVRTEVDKQGVPAMQALKRLSQNGSLKFAEDKSSLSAVFADLANRIRNFYVYEYYSPNLVGSHDLVVEVTANGKVGRSQPVNYSTGANTTTLNPADQALFESRKQAIEACIGSDECNLDTELGVWDMQFKGRDPFNAVLTRELAQRVQVAFHERCERRSDCDYRLEILVRFGLTAEELAFGERLCSNESARGQCAAWTGMAGAYPEFLEASRPNVRLLCGAEPFNESLCSTAVRGFAANPKLAELLPGVCEAHPHACKTAYMATLHLDKALQHSVLGVGCEAGDKPSCLQLQGHCLMPGEKAACSLLQGVCENGNDHACSLLQALPQ